MVVCFGLASSVAGSGLVLRGNYLFVLKGSGVGVVVASRSREGCCPSISL